MRKLPEGMWANSIPREFRHISSAAGEEVGKTRVQMRKAQIDISVRFIIFSPKTWLHEILLFLLL
jgi:hypothetical protein